MSVRNTAKAAHSLKELSIDWLIQTLCFLHAFLMSTGSQWLTVTYGRSVGTTDYYRHEALDCPSPSNKQ